MSYCIKILVILGSKELSNMKKKKKFLDVLSFFFMGRPGSSCFTWFVLDLQRYRPRHEARVISSSRITNFGHWALMCVPDGFFAFPLRKPHDCKKWNSHVSDWCCIDTGWLLSLLLYRMPLVLVWFLLKKPHDCKKFIRHGSDFDATTRCSGFGLQILEWS